MSITEDNFWKIWLDNEENVLYNDDFNTDNYEDIEDIIEIIEDINGHLKKLDETSYKLLKRITEKILSDDEINVIIDDIAEIDNEHRYDYSVIYRFIANVYDYEPELVEYIQANIETLEDKLFNHPRKTVKHDKFTQYVLMETGRITRIGAVLNTIDSNAYRQEETEEKLEKVLKKEKKLNKRLREYVEKMDKAQIEVITVLSIFTSIVLSFVGGMAFSTSVLENIHKTDIYRLLFVMIILGLVLVNAIWGLLAVIKYINKNIEACSKPFKTINAILIALLILNGIAYGFDIFEAENKMNQQLNSGTNEAVSITNSNVNNKENKDKTTEKKTEESKEKTTKK